MARETQKAKIERLENELKQANQIIQKLNNEIGMMQDNADKNFNNSADYIQMKKQIKDLELKLKVSEDSKEHNRRMYEAELKKNDEIRTNENTKRLEEEIQKLKNEKRKISRSKVIRENEELKKEIERKEEHIQSLYLQQMKADEEVKKVKEEHQELFKAYKKDLERVEEEYKKDNTKKHNERGAGRKARFSDSEIETIRMYRIQGKTIKEIAEMFSCSVGLIHKLISEKAC